MGILLRYIDIDMGILICRGGSSTGATGAKAPTQITKKNYEKAPKTNNLQAEIRSCLL